MCLSGTRCRCIESKENTWIFVINKPETQASARLSRHKRGFKYEPRQLREKSRGEDLNRGSLLFLGRKDNAISGSARNLEERYVNHAGTVAKLRKADIAKQLRRDRLSIYDDLRQGADSAGEYCEHRGQQVRQAASARSSANVIGKSCAQRP